MMLEMAAYFRVLWDERVVSEPKFDLISMMAHSEATRDMSMSKFIGNLGLLIVGGNDTTRNSMSGGLWYLRQNPDELAKLKANPALVDTLVLRCSLSDAGHPHASHGIARCRVGRSIKSAKAIRWSCGMSLQIVIKGHRGPGPLSDRSRSRASICHTGREYTAVWGPPRRFAA